MVVIRMMRVGSKKKPYFRVVVTEARTARESSFVENLGTYNPRAKPALVQINKERVEHWLKKGARPSDSVRTLIGEAPVARLVGSAVDARCAGTVMAAGGAAAETAAVPCARWSKSSSGRWSISRTRFA